MSIHESEPPSDAELRPKPLAVSVRKACEIIGVGNTTMWGLIKSGRVKTTSIGRRRLVIYSTLEALVAPPVDAAKNAR
jgi:excisionase family DNA binding protein